MSTATPSLRPWVERVRRGWRASPLPGFLGWWGGQLRELLPPRWRGWFGGGADWHLLQHTGTQWSVRRSGHAEVLASWDDGADTAAPGAVAASRGEGAGAAAAGGSGAAIEDYTPVSYNYAFFHLIFALASMYIAMLLTGWGAVAQEKDRLDVGWTSVWVKVGAEWVTGLLYCWTLVAPGLFPDREFM